MLYLLRISRKCKKLKNKYIIIMGLSEDEQEALEAKEALEAEEAKEALIQGLKAELDVLLKELQGFQGVMDGILKKYKPDTKIEEIEKKDPEAIKQLNKYSSIYSKYSTTLQAIVMAESINDKSYWTTFVIDPISDFFGDFGNKIKKGTATFATGTAKLGADIFAESMRQMQPSLEEIKRIQAEIAAAGKLGELPGIKGPELPGIKGPELPGIKGPGSAFSTADTRQLVSQGGGRPLSIKEVQKGGAAAAKRAQDSIKQFLSSSVTSSHILNMVKRKTKAKRKRNEKRSKYSRKRARK
jgi:putative sterol carrier protein